MAKYYYMECEQCNRHWEVEESKNTDHCKRCLQPTWQQVKDN